MSKRISLFLLLVLLAAPIFGETWYVRPDGGSRHSAKTTSGQCDGKADAAFRGKGVNQHCAFNDYRYLWDDRSYANSKWVIAGGDTVILRGGPWRVGFNQGVTANDVWCSGGNGAFSCINPTIPAGTAAQPTRILGENYADCGSAKKTQIFGGYGVWAALNLGGAQFVQVECLEITRHSQCVVHGSPAYPKTCSSSYPIDDYDSDGVYTDVNTHDVLLQDLWIHGHTDRGVKGPIGGVVTAERVDIAYNGMAGWDFDDGNATSSVNGVWNFRNSIIEWSGCNQEYPITHANPAISCYGQSSGGYGDGVGTPPNMCLSANIDHSTFRYNTQDGLDLGHIDKGSCSLNVTNSTAYGNSGGQFKWGPNENPAVFVNNLVLGNCMRMSAPIEGTPSTYNSKLGDFCRAQDAISFNFRQGGAVFFANNTIVSYSPTTFDIDCWDPSCSNSVLTFKNNIVRGIDNSATYSLGGRPSGPGGLFFQKPIGKVIRENNIFFGMRGLRCPTGYATERCEDPRLATQVHFSKEQDLDGFNFKLSDASPALRSGTRIPEIKTDYDGKPRPASGNYDVGALQR